MWDFIGKWVPFGILWIYHRPNWSVTIGFALPACWLPSDNCHVVFKKIYIVHTVIEEDGATCQIQPTVGPISPFHKMLYGGTPSKPDTGLYHHSWPTSVTLHSVRSHNWAIKFPRSNLVSYKKSFLPPGSFLPQQDWNSSRCSNFQQKALMVPTDQCYHLFHDTLWCCLFLVFFKYTCAPKLDMCS